MRKSSIKQKEIQKRRIILLIFILLIFLGVLMVVKFYLTKDKINFEYIYSDEMKNGTFSPKMIHLVIAAYEGDVNPKSISKSTYYMITTKIPEYLKNCSDNNTEKYFNKNKDSIYLDTGITNKDDFDKLIKELSKLSGKLELEYAIFDRETIKVNKTNLEVVLKIKYKDQEEISLNVRIKNKQRDEVPSIEYYK